MTCNATKPGTSRKCVLSAGHKNPRHTYAPAPVEETMDRSDAEVLLERHENQHDERGDYDGCAICRVAMDLAAKAWDTTGTDEAAVARFRADYGL